MWFSFSIKIRTDICLKSTRKLIESLYERIKKLTNLKERLFPDQKLQERTQNLLHFCNSKGIDERINELYNAIDPLSNDFTVLIEKENDSK